MSETDQNSNPEARELVISRQINATPDRVFEAYTTPKLLKQWWVPRPWTISACEIDARPGGVFNSTLCDPEGKEYPNQGLLLEVVPGKRIVFTDAFTAGWQPKPDPFIVAIIDLQERDGGTLVTAHVRHWTVVDRDRHETMGFYDGWGQALSQLDELLTKTPQPA